MRGELLLQLAALGWRYSGEMDFLHLAAMPPFRGHTATSLELTYLGMAQAAGRGTRAARVPREQVEQWWAEANTSGKTDRKRLKEQKMVAIYYKVLKKIGEKKK